ncbi:LysR family transcriptional regulator [Marinomonas sp. SBI22]|uniref:LysR substrate-binding domain-containing protein n=1 Tax=unclassified Marinomonas TaxID=196814 RepID=UPI0007AEEB94|nr:MULTISPECIES: LysR substrate-binding domain-containing protein [unclassified Marinomonas]KZM40064.1 LysR family transcriptional regulator [Marinomonas sp. SBI22]KZM41358.1 LysR family transcriptional regulator [Marinomonas sp. SBI8L]
MKITLRQLQIFEAVVHTGSVTAAADLVAISQPAASQALRELEALLGRPLFRRHGKRLQITPQARNLLPQARAVLSQIDQIESMGSSDELSGSLHLATSVSIGNYLLPKQMASFSQQHPQIRFNLDIGNTQSVIQQLLTGKAEVGFIEGYCQHAELTVEPWLQDELVVFGSAKEERSSELSWEELAESNWVMREGGSGTRTILEQAISEQLTQLKVSLSLTHMEAVKQAVIHQMGLGCLSRMAVSQELEAGHIRLYKTPLKLNRNLLIVTPKGSALTQNAQCFVDQCRSLSSEEISNNKHINS